MEFKTLVDSMSKLATMSTHDNYSWFVFVLCIYILTRIYILKIMIIKNSCCLKSNIVNLDSRIKLSFSFIMCNNVESFFNGGNNFEHEYVMTCLFIDFMKSHPELS